MRSSPTSRRHVESGDRRSGRAAKRRSKRRLTSLESAREGLYEVVDGWGQGRQIAVIHASGVEAFRQVYQRLEEVAGGRRLGCHGHLFGVVLHDRHRLDGLDAPLNNFDG